MFHVLVLSLLVCFNFSLSFSRYYYNKKTRQSSWEKPVELMTPLEVSVLFAVMQLSHMILICLAMLVPDIIFHYQSSIVQFPMYFCA